MGGGGGGGVGAILPNIFVKIHSMKVNHADNLQSTKISNNDIPNE